MKSASYETKAAYLLARHRSMATMQAGLLQMIANAEEAMSNGRDLLGIELRLRGQCVCTLWLLANLEPHAAVEPYRRLCALLRDDLEMPSTFVAFLAAQAGQGPVRSNVVDLLSWRAYRGR